MASEVLQEQERAGAEIAAAFNRAFTTDEAAKANLMPWTLRRLEQRGDVYRIARGIYVPRQIAPDHQTYAAEVGIRFPEALICLRSAAELHGLTLEFRADVFLAQKLDWRPIPARLGNEVDGLRRIYWARWHQHGLEKGIMSMEIHGVPIKVTTPARTVVDYFRYRNKAIFGKEERMMVLDRYLSRRSMREYDTELFDLAATFGVKQHLSLLVEGRRDLVMRRADPFLKAGF